MRAITMLTDSFRAEKTIEEFPSCQEMATKDEAKDFELWEFVENLAFIVETARFDCLISIATKVAYFTKHTAAFRPE